MKGRGWYGASISSLGVALMAAAALLLVLMLYQFVGPFRYLGDGTALPVREVVLWLPANASPQEPATARRIDGWRRVLPEAGKLFRGPDLPGPPEGHVVAVPDARRLEPAELAALLDFVRAGGGAVLAGSLGVRDAGDGWRGYEGMGLVLGVDRVEPLATELASALVARGRGPLAALLAPDTPLELLPEDGLPAIPTLESEIVWHESGSGAASPRGASRRREMGGGRLAWVAAGPESGTESSFSDLDRILRAAVDWAAREPVVAVLPAGPGGAAPSGDEWRRLDALLDASVERVGAERLRVSVTQRGRKPVDGAVLEIYVGSPVGAADVTATVVGQELPGLTRWPADDLLELRLPALGPGSHAWNIEWSQSPTRKEST
ncbi:MAG: hypothetical protein QNK04_05560 [Myxococcota bacterium]|nr:hypothetical protein [Myxococcota bacterium]